MVIELSRKRDNSICVMLGGSAVSATGVYLAVRRVQNDVIILFHAMTSSRHRAPEFGDEPGASILTGPFRRLRPEIYSFRWRMLAGRCEIGGPCGGRKDLPP